MQNDAAVGSGERQWTVQATGRRTILRIQRELREPDPAQPGHRRRAHPPVTDLTHFGEEVPARPAALPSGRKCDAVAGGYSEWRVAILRFFVLLCLRGGVLEEFGSA